MALDNLPPFPAVAIRLVRMLAQEDIDIAQVGKMISAEPVLPRVYCNWRTPRCSRLRGR